MKEESYKGKISFINFEKQFATIDYWAGSKPKSVNCKLADVFDGKKQHHVRLNDEVSFELRLSDRGDKMAPINIQYRHNPAIDLLVQKAQFENRFSGYLKKIEDDYFVKEINHYVLFPLQLSPWELPPADTAENISISFSLVNLDKPKNIAAALFSHYYLPEYKKAQMHFEKKYAIAAVVSRITAHAVYVNLFTDKIQVKLPVSDEEKETFKIGDTVNVLITHMTDRRIVVERVRE